MTITVEVPFSFDMFIAPKQEVPPDGVVMDVPLVKSQRDMMSMIVWDPITIQVGSFLGTQIAIPLFVSWLYDTFKNAPTKPKITIERREVTWERGEIARAIEEIIKIE